MGYIPEEIIAQIIDRCDIVDVTSSYFPLKKAGRNFKALSPFKPEKTPSFVVSPDKQIFHCFSTGEGGNVITFVMKMERISFPEAVQILADKAGITIPKSKGDSIKSSLKQAILKTNEAAVEYFHHNLTIGKSKDIETAREYLKKRGVSLEIVQNFKIGFALDSWDGLLNHLRAKDINLTLLEKAGLIIARDRRDGFYDRFRNRITFPIFDVRSHCVGFGARSLKDDEAKYINSPETEAYIKGKHLFGLNMAKDSIAREDQVIVVEGYMDFVMPYQSGVQNSVASLGTALTVDQIRLLRRYTRNVVLLFDTDQAGESAMLRSVDLLIEEGMNVRIASLGKNEDPDSYIRQFGVDSFKERIEKAQTIFEYKLQVLLKRYDHVTIEGRAKICSEMLPTINKFDNAVIRAEYIKYLAENLSVSQEALLAELSKFSQSDTAEKRGYKVIESKPEDQKVKKAEYNIIKVLLKDHSYIPMTQEVVDLADFQDEKARVIMKRIYQLYEQHQCVQPTDLLSSFEDTRILKIISGVMVEEDHFQEENIGKIHKDCISRIRLDRNKLQRQELLGQIKKAEVQGDHEQLNLLKEKFNQLIQNNN